MTPVWTEFEWNRVYNLQSPQKFLRDTHVAIDNSTSNISYAKCRKLIFMAVKMFENGHWWS